MRKHLFASAALAGMALFGATAQAQTPFIGQVEAYGFNFCPRNYAPADGRILSIQDNTALFSLYGTMYGGNGVSTFALPNLNGRRAMGEGHGPGLTPRPQGSVVGTETETMTAATMPTHEHLFLGSTETNSTGTPSGATVGTFPSAQAYSDPGTSDVQMNSGTIGSAGGSQPFSVNGPYLAVTYCVALQGLYPSRN